MLQEVAPDAHGEEAERAPGQRRGAFDGHIEATGFGRGATGIRHASTLSKGGGVSNSAREVRDDRGEPPA
ncbi:hypothetical protein GCM10009651_13620 [Microbacterium natoriense]